MNQPLDLAPIQARHQAATGGTWRYESYAGLGPNGVLGAANIPIGRLDFGNGDQADADRDFVLNAHTDMGDLLAEVLRLRELLATAEAIRYQALTEAADWFEAGCPHLGKNSPFTVCTCSAATYLREHARDLATNTNEER